MAILLQSLKHKGNRGRKGVTCRENTHRYIK